jgi:hypothetical protein
MIRENINISAKKSLGYYELKKHKPWFNVLWSKLLDKRKQAKLQWLQDGDSVNNKAGRLFRNNMGEYLKDKINDLPLNSKNKNIRDLYRGINYFKKGNQPTTNLVMVENGDLLADSHNILNMWKNYISQSLNVHRSVMLGR